MTVPAGDHLARTMLETSLDQHPLDMAADIALQVTQDTFNDHTMNPHDRRVLVAEVDYLLR